MSLPTLPTLRRFGARCFWIFSVPIAINDYALELTPVTGHSMTPTLSPTFNTTGEKDTLAWRKYQPARDLQRGDIVMYHSPFKDNGTAVKRVIALGGDEVVLDKRRRPGTDDNGEPRASERTVMRNWDAMAPRVRVPYGHVWVEGDNAEASSDSNWFGPVSRSLIIGKAVGVVWPPERWGRVWEAEGGGQTFVGRTRVVRGRDVVPVEWEELVLGVVHGVEEEE